MANNTQLRHVANLATCPQCEEQIDPRRTKLGYTLCLFCSEELERQQPTIRCIVPMHKSNYVVITNPDDLLGINNKGGLVK